MAPQETDQGLGDHANLRFRGEVEIQLRHSHHHLEGGGEITTVKMISQQKRRLRVPYQLSGLLAQQHSSANVLNLSKRMKQILFSRGEKVETHTRTQSDNIREKGVLSPNLCCKQKMKINDGRWDVIAHKTAF